MIKLLVLELLSQSPMSGYEMKQILEQSDAKRWGNVLPGSIYNALKNLASENYIEISKIEMTGNRQRSEYRITEKGKTLLNELVVDALSTSIRFNGDLYSGIGFAYQIDPALAISILKKNIKQLDNEANEIKQGIKVKATATDGDLPALSSLVVAHMLKSIKLQKELLNSVISTIQNETD